jgi:Rps23 Pro-64 3,4-dihydroxylase Tpa1-like proline 4-hydroxylase
MTMPSQQDIRASAPPGKSIMPPHTVLRDFLDEQTAADLLDQTLAWEAKFKPTRVASKAVDPAVRVSLGTRELGAFAPLLERKIAAIVPALVAALKATPFEPDSVELQLVAHGDGAFYKRHIDTQTARNADKDHIRVLSGVYYFHVTPKAFSGGALRLHAIGGRGEEFVDVMPEHNSLLVFPSWAPHEVTPVRCPSGRFRDARFAVNCWIRRKKG